MDRIYGDRALNFHFWLKHNSSNVSLIKLYFFTLIVVSNWNKIK